MPKRFATFRMSIPFSMHLVAKVWRSVWKFASSISKNKIIIVKRNKNSKFGGGSWQIPGGKIEVGESSRSAGIREIREELSISINEDQLEHIGTFYDKDISDRTKVIQIELFVCLIDDSSGQVKLNHENEEWKWVNVPDLPCLDIPIFGINRKMLVSVWREFAVARKLEMILDNFDEYSNGFLSRIDGINDSELNVLYGFLSLLGIVQNTNRIVPTSDYSKKIIEALICISRSGGCVFKNDNVDTLSSLGLTKNDFSVFSSNRNMMTYSHKALLSVLSSMAEMKNSRRNVCDVLIFGQYQGKIYLLLRWDFYADKYQVVSAGLKSDFQPGEYEKNAKYVVSHRLGEVFSNGFEYFGMGQFSTKHFSGGSVDNDPILRTYYIDYVKNIICVVGCDETISIKNAWLDYDWNKNKIYVLHDELNTEEKEKILKNIVKKKGKEIGERR